MENCGALGIVDSANGVVESAVLVDGRRSAVNGVVESPEKDVVEPPEKDIIDSDAVLSEVLAAEDVVLHQPDDVLPESQPNSITQDSELAPDSMEMVPDSLPPDSITQFSEAFVCRSCGDVHENREAWNRRHSRFYPCGLCGLIHEDFAISAVLGLVDNKTIVKSLANCERFAVHYPGWLPTEEDGKATVMFSNHYNRQCSN